MTWFRNVAKGIASLLRRQQVERELDEELQGFFEASVARKQRDGMTADDARRAAGAELGSLYFLHLFARLSNQAATHKAALAQSQNWLNQQVRSGIREREGASISTDRQVEIGRTNIPLVPAAHGISIFRSE